MNATRLEKVVDSNQHPTPNIAASTSQRYQFRLDSVGLDKG